jgi:ABC-type phosphate/phosphonate transport system substrate-binding protein
MRIAMALPMVARVPRRLCVATFLSPRLEPLYRVLAERAADALGRRLEFVVGRTYAELETDRVDVAFVCGPPYLARSDRYEAVAAPVLADPRGGGRPVYFADVVVAGERIGSTFADLRGATLAYNEPGSWSGYHSVRTHLAALGEAADFFGATVEAGFHDRALRLVAEAGADAAAIDSHVLALLLRDGFVAPGAVRTIAAIGPAPIQPVVASRALSPHDRSRIAAAVVGANGDPLLARSLVERFVAVGPDHADGLRAGLAAADAAGIDLRTRSSRAAGRRGWVA